MIAARPPSSRRKHHALTLLEVLLTLSLLVVLAAITWPALDRPIANQRLRKAADVVRVEWARVRVKATSSGQTCMFRYALDGNRYAIQYQADPEFVSQATSGDGFGAFSKDLQSAAVVQATERTLPEGVTFVAGETSFAAGSEMIVSEQQLSTTEFGWSEPILFYPDGTTSTASVQLKNEYDRTIEISLRGLTGVVTVGEVQSGEDI